jgi:C-terminal processing protease CtpA/Prc
VLPVALALAADSPAESPTDPLSLEDKIFGLSMIWQEANYNFAFFDLNPDLDWDAEYRRALVRARTTTTTWEYVREAQRFVALLGEAHTNLEPGKELRARYGAKPPIELEEIERRAIVVNTTKDLAAELPLGSEIVRVNGRPTAAVLEEDVFPYLSASTEDYRWRQSIRGQSWRAVGLLAGETGSRVALTVEAPDGDVREVVVERGIVSKDAEWVRPPRRETPVLEFRWLDDGIAYVALNTFNDPAVVERFDEKLDELRGSRAVVLDVRRNGGGNSKNGWDIGRWFSAEALATSRWKTRHHLAAYKAWGARSKNPEKQAHAAMNAWDGPEEPSRVEPPEGEILDVPLAILLGPSTYSAAEDFLSYMRANPRCLYVGRRSAGSTGQPLKLEIPGGAWVGITSKRDAMPDGTEFVGYGIAPDVEVHQTVAAFRAGRDLVLERAVEEMGRVAER